MTGRSLAQAAGITADTLSRLEKGYRAPEEGTVEKLAVALGYPPDFFFNDDPIDIDSAGVSFRSFSKMSAAEKGAAKSAGQLGVELSSWVETRFNLPKPDVPDLSYQTDPEKAAVEIRQYWGIGERPIGNMIGLLENKGIRVLSLSEDTANVNAFSFWRDGKPYVFLNNFKTAESSIFDSAHELGHLLMHCKGDFNDGRLLEREADTFAGAFLLPANDVRAKVTRPVTVQKIISAKGRWRVSAFALLYRLWRMNIVSTEHQYRSLCIELSKRGYRSGEPLGIEREISTVWKQVFSALWEERFTKNDLARELNLPIDELEGLVANMSGEKFRPAQRQIRQV